MRSYMETWGSGGGAQKARRCVRQSVLEPGCQSVRTGRADAESTRKDGLYWERWSGGREGVDGTSLQIWAAELKPTHTTDTDLRACSRGREKGN